MVYRFWPVEKPVDNVNKYLYALSENGINVDFWF
jgi:hypothetical protein